MALQVSEGTAVRKLEAATQKLSKQEAHLLRLERKIDEKDQALYHAKMEARNKAKFLKRTIQDLRRQYSGALPLMKQVHALHYLLITQVNLNHDFLTLGKDRFEVGKCTQVHFDSKLLDIPDFVNGLNGVIVRVRVVLKITVVVVWRSVNLSGSHFQESRYWR